MKLYNGNCLDELKNLEDNSIDSVVTDPPYGLSFMGKKWDYDVPSVDIWKECLRVLKPGGHLLAFAGTRTQHRMTTNIEDAGFEIRDMLVWTYLSGFPKNLNVGMAVDKLQGNKREVVGTSDKGIAGGSKEFTKGNESTMGFNGEYEITKGSSEWEGWGTCLKPSIEPITLARKPVSEKTIAQNVLKHRTGALNIDASRVEYDDKDPSKKSNMKASLKEGKEHANAVWKDTGHKVRKDIFNEDGRYPANFIHDGSDEVKECFPEVQVGFKKLNGSRVFYCPKPDTKDRDDGLDREERTVKNALTTHNGTGEYRGVDKKPLAKRKNFHPTVKPTNLMKYLVNLITPPNGTCLDPFMGSGSTGKACKIDGFDFVGVELDKEYFEIAKERIENTKEKRKLF